MMSTNLRGFHSKKETFANIISHIGVDVVFVQETHTSGKSKINVPGFYSFARNRPKMGSKGGIAILVRERVKDSCVLIHEGKNSEILAVKMCNTNPHLCLITYYGKQENTTSWPELHDDIAELFDLANKLSEEGNIVVVAGDWNVAIGCGVLTDNNPSISRGGRLFNNLLDLSPDLMMANSRYPGSSITHTDASGGAGRCLDIVLMNSLAEERLGQFLVDETRVITPYRYIAKTGEKRYSDHVSLYWEMTVKRVIDQSEMPIRVWNYSKPLGDGKFAYNLERSVPKLIKCYEMNDDVNIVFKKIRTEVKNAKYRGYGVREIEVKTWDKIEDERIELKRLEEIKKTVEKYRKDPKMKTVPLQIFGARKSILLAERDDMVSSIKHPVTGRMVETRKEIAEATILHNKITLSQNEVKHESYARLTDFKTQYIEMSKLVESRDEKDETIYFEDYLDTLKELQSRNKSCYADIKKWGPRFRIFIYWIMKRLYEREEVPEEFLETSLRALYKKGPRSDLGNYRFLHLKECLAKTYETLVMKKIKPDLWRAYPISQIGGCPNSRCTEHLYLLVTLMIMCEQRDEWSLDGFIIIFKDVIKAFDKIGVKQTLYAAAKAGVKGKNLRIMEKMNEKTVFSVVGDPDNTKFEKEWVSGQGTVFTCTACSKAMPDPMNELLAAREKETGEHLGLRVGPDRVVVEEVDFVDDEGAICKDVESAREKGVLITRAMNQLNVECHKTKTRYMIVGKPSYVEEMTRQLEEEPIVIQGFEVQRSWSEKYLGMFINANGARATVREQMEARLKECQGKVAVIKGLMERPTMREIGYLAGLRTLFNSVVTSTALYSAGTWVGATKADIEYFDRGMKSLWYTLLRLNSRTKWLQVCWECDLLPWSYGIMREKINLCNFLHFGKISQSGLLAVSESTHGWRKGLVAEARKWAARLGINDPAATPISKETVTEAVRRAARLEMWESVSSSRYIHVTVRAERYVPDYFYNSTLSNHEQKIWLSYRLGILEFRRRYANKHNTVKCIYENCQEDDTLEHSKVCPENPVKWKQDGDEGDTLTYLKNLHSERLRKVGIGIYWL